MKITEIQSWPDRSQPFFSLSNSLWALVPLEAWRRGLEVTLRPNARYTISDGESRRTFWQTRLTGPTQDAIARASDDKNATREMLLRAGLPAPQGRSFRKDFTSSDILAYARQLGFPVCLKPNAWAKGRGVYPRLENEQDLSAALAHIVDELGCDDLVLEQHIRGDALRVSVAGGRVVAVTRAEPANVVGDGSSTISELIDAKNIARGENPHLRNHRLQLDEQTERILAAAGLKPRSVPEEGRIVHLREAANLAQGGDSWDITDELPREISEIAIAAVDATPGLAHAGVDLLVEDASRADSAVFINELNPSAGLGGHVYPGHGTPRDVPAAIVDQYFPGTTRKTGSDAWYFPLDAANRLLVSRSAAAIEVPPMPEPRTPTWNVLRVDDARERLPTLRATLLGKLIRTQVHGQIGRIHEGSFDISLAGEGKAVEASSQVVRREASAARARVRVASRARFPAAVGMRLA
ncbi:MAG: hypothetical protein ACTH1T_07475 [Brachybacterium tyrofermentans]